VCERARERETRFEMRKKERTEEHEALPSFINRKDFPLLKIPYLRVRLVRGLSHVLLE
jgi:hypothetical protein